MLIKGSAHINDQSSAKCTLLDYVTQQKGSLTSSVYQNWVQGVMNVGGFAVASFTNEPLQNCYSAMVFNQISASLSLLPPLTLINSLSFNTLTLMDYANALPVSNVNKRGWINLLSQSGAMPYQAFTDPVIQSCYVGMIFNQVQPATTLLSTTTQINFVSINNQTLLDYANALPASNSNQISFKQSWVNAITQLHGLPFAQIGSNYQGGSGTGSVIVPGITKPTSNVGVATSTVLTFTSTASRRSNYLIQTSYQGTPMF